MSWPSLFLRNTLVRCTLPACFLHVIRRESAHYHNARIAQLTDCFEGHVGMPHTFDLVLYPHTYLPNPWGTVRPLSRGHPYR